MGVGLLLALGSLSSILSSTCLADTSELSGYGGLSPYAGDVHIHAALASSWEVVSRASHDPERLRAHEYKLPATVYDLCREHGLDFCAITHHSRRIDDTDANAWWMSPDNPDLHGIGTDPRGFPLPNGGFTASELEWLQAVARDRTVPGTFVALYGIEYTVQSLLHEGCVPGQAQCGGHKLAICPHAEVGTRCSHTAQGPGACPSEREFYVFLDENECAGIAAHPCTNIPADFSPAVPGGGGWDDAAMSGYEFGARCENGVSLGERIAGTLQPSREQIGTAMPLGPFGLLRDPGGIARELRLRAAAGWRRLVGGEGFLPDGSDRWSYAYALGELGLKVGVTAGSDTHNRPIPRAGAEGWGPNAVPGTTSRMLCWAEALSADAIVASLRQMRCYWVADPAKPIVQFSLEGRPIGATIPLGALAARHSVQLRVDARSDAAGRPFRSFDVIHDGAPVLHAVPCPAGHCEHEQHLESDDPRGYWYLRIRSEDQALAVTSPIWIE